MLMSSIKYNRSVVRLLDVFRIIEGRRHILRSIMTKKRIDLDSDLSNMLKEYHKRARKDPLRSDSGFLTRNSFSH
jgi:hypothetical protein